jgi:hypothetical protein
VTVRGRKAKLAAAAALVILFAVRHDVWWWSDATLVMGMPIGLASQVLICLLAMPAFAWAAEAFGLEDEQ